MAQCLKINKSLRLQPRLSLNCCLRYCKERDAAEALNNLKIKVVQVFSAQIITQMERRVRQQQVGAKDRNSRREKRGIRSSNF